ncbi:MAG: peptidase M48 [Bacteroidetes bacterium QH_8_67_23]|nr:MAG: peptidase M48 [Bacteroidetes bacterium QH_8_67_23]
MSRPSPPASASRSMFHVKRSARLLRRYLLVMVMAVALAGGTTGCVSTGTNPVSGDERVYGYSWEEEKKLGAQSHEKIKAQYGIYNEGGEAQQYVDDVGQRVLAESDLREAQAGKQQLGQLGLIAAALGTQALGGPGGQVARLGQTATKLLFLEYSRDNEEESDKRGVEYAAKAGYEASEGAEFFRTLERIQEKRGQTLPTWQSTHPDPGNRRARIPKLAQRFGEGSTVDQDAYMNTLEGMIMGENPRNGYVDDNTFFHPNMRFQFSVPSGFDVDNTPQRVVMAEQNQRAQMVFTLSDASSAQQAAQKTLRQINQQRGAQVVDRGRAESNGLPAYSLTVEAQSQRKQIGALLYFVEYDGQVYSFQGAAPAQVFSRYENVFSRTMRSFAPLRDESRLDVQPVHLEVRRVDQRAPFETFTDRRPSDLSGLTPQDLAIINQVEMNQTVKAGRPLKLPR